LPREHRFEAELVRLATESKAIGYNPSYFLRMIHDLGGVETARRLINSDAPSDGFVKLWELGRLDLTVEALVSRSAEFRSLFSSSEILKAQKRLAEYGDRG
jgi:hypothetical protein